MVKFKHDIDSGDLEEVKPALWILLTRAVLYCDSHSLPLTITSIKSDRENIESVSKSHEDFRAIDVSVRGWTDQHIHRFVYMMNRDYSDIAALSYSDNKPRAAIYHDSGYGDHIHLQVRPNANINRFIED
jgi:hypothetical protein